MKVMQFSLKLLALLGIAPGKSIPAYSAVKWFAWLSIAIVCIPQINFLLFHGDSLEKIIKSLSFTGNNILTIAKTWSFHQKHREIHQMLHLTNAIANRDATAYERVERKISVISKIYSSFGLFAIISIILPSVFDIIYHRPFGNPFVTAYGIPADSKIYLHSISLLEFMCHMVMGISHFSVDVFYWGMCIYIAQFFTDLALFVSSQRRLDAKENVVYHFPFIDIWKKHQEILHLSKLLQASFSQIFFIQFIMSGLVLCIMIYRASISWNDPGVMVTMLVSTCSANVEIFTMCWFSSMVTSESARMSNEFYFLNWYDFTATDRQRVKFMLFRSQKSIEFNGIGIFKCNMATFRGVLNFTGSAITLLQSLH